MPTFEVYLNDQIVGHLGEGDRGRIAFRFAGDYRRLANRPVLSQSFEDNLEKVYVGPRGLLPPFFANVIPEGTALRAVLEASLGVDASDDLALLAAVGEDLPGALRIRAGETLPFPSLEQHDEEQAEALHDEPAFRFSLAGVQLKFSVLNEGQRLVVPVRGKGGEWIVKMPSHQFPGLTRNEFAVMTWASLMGFEVPEISLVNRDQLPAVMKLHYSGDEQSLLVRRYDRRGDERIHQEDFAQVIGCAPKDKYKFSYEKCGLLVREICGHEAYTEFVRRLAFAIASGNMDAHLKNWSFLYGDGESATLAPMYDQVFTCAYAEVQRDLALKLTGVRAVTEVAEQSFRALGKAAGADPNQTAGVAMETIDQASRVWLGNDLSGLLPDGHGALLRAYWSAVPILRRHAAL